MKWTEEASERMDMKGFYVQFGILFLLTFTSLCLDEGGEKWQSGIISVTFNQGVNETEVREVIESYNLSIKEISDHSEIIQVEVTVPEGEEEAYIDLIEKNPKVNKAIRIPSVPE